MMKIKKINKEYHYLQIGDLVEYSFGFRNNDLFIITNIRIDYGDYEVYNIQTSETCYLRKEYFRLATI